MRRGSARERNPDRVAAFDYALRNNNFWAPYRKTELS